MFHTTPSFELPEKLIPVFDKAKKLEWITIAYLVSVVILMFLVMGSSQAMKTAWIEDAMSSIPAISFLIASRIYDRKPNHLFPYGYHRVFTIAFLAGSVALFSIGLFLAYDSSMSLLSGEHPTIGSMMVFDHQIWMGWIMILALCYSAFPAMYLGYKKLPLAKKLHNKILYADADTQKADYQTALAAMAGIVGVGFGLWWADATAALFISLSVIKDGYKNLKNATQDLMDREPKIISEDTIDPLLNEIGKTVENWDWVNESKIRFREHGQVYFGEILIVPNSSDDISNKVEKAVKDIHALHWKIQDVVISPVSKEILHGKGGLK